MHREKWGTKLGFMLAAMGSAVGLGNIWRFSFVAGNNGGGAFLLLYLLFVLIIGIPLLLTEVSIGRKAESDVVGSFQKLAKGTPWYLTGFFGIISSFLILSFYAVVAGWAIFYFWNYINGSFFTQPAVGYEGAFGQFISHTWHPIAWTALFMILTITIVLSGVKKGIEAANKIFMPLLALILIALAVFSLSLDGASEGVKFLFQPNWSALSEPSIYIAALGQAFFSLSLGMGAMLTYGSYLRKENKLPSAALGIGLMDTFFAVISGLVIFPAVFAFGIDPSSGPPLVFITLPSIFEQMPFGGIIGLVFFFALILASLSSSVSILEVPTAYFMRVFSWTRFATSVLMGSIMFVMGIAVSLGFGIWSGVTPIGEKNILDSMDYIASNILLPLGGLSMALLVGWYFKKSEALESADLSSSSIGGFWYFIVKWMAPILIVLIFLNKIGIIF
ncbi:sodium-dependent transporter [Halobacillus halophilus]|uniref:Sodium-dependent transporter n=1 Tax=Halobacillus halophilus (strain ATCC 35676 / DSM 2266 / JCM 20832 / KCTC 3685 / LMG 17431 / NBRC 102448 / NCIMB 2269) TaxID=866895 RepID=I0JS82_HALH3|nr:sodium-dependent transporter [Halobacillus halophilus]ASF40941.1 sodium-dependent transporter [Halobacillus halophilus]CCG47003.1 sodium-dependent transporter [Halobacillus halophilus DSM 2266]